MINFAELDENNNVINVIVATDASITQLSGKFIKCSGVTGDVAIGGHYDRDANKFVAPRPFPSWILNEDLEWESPLGEKPNDGNIYTWDEEGQEWLLLRTINIEV